MIVDDQADIRQLLRLVLRLDGGNGLEVSCEAATGVEAIAMVEGCDPTVIVLDHMMPGLSGVDTARQIRRGRPAQLMVLCSAYLDDDVERAAHDAGIAAVLHKDKVRELAAVIRELVA